MVNNNILVQVFVCMIEELREDPAPFKKLKEMLDLEGVIVYTQLDGYRCFLPQN